MKLTVDTSEKEKEIYRQKILEKAKKINPDLITKKNIRQNSELLEATEDHIVRLFGSLTAFKSLLGIKSFYKTDKDIVESVKEVAKKLNLNHISREQYELNKKKEDPSLNAQYNFMHKNKIEFYSDFIDYCLNHDNVYDLNLTKNTFEKEKNKIKLENQIQDLLDKGYYDKEIEEKFGINSNTVRRYRLKYKIDNNYKKLLKEIK